LDDEDYQCEHQQNVDESTHGVAADETQQPQDQEDYKDCPKHFNLPKILDISTTQAWTPCRIPQVVREMQNLLEARGAALEIQVQLISYTRHTCPKMMFSFAN
jgi:hypothetical protein